MCRIFIQRRNHEKKQSITKHNKMLELVKHNFEPKKSDLEEYTLYDFIYRGTKADKSNL